MTEIQNKAIAFPPVNHYLNAKHPCLLQQMYCQARNLFLASTCAYFCNTFVTEVTYIIMRSVMYASTIRTDIVADVLSKKQRINKCVLLVLIEIWMRT